MDPVTALVRPLASNVSRHIMLAGVGVIAATGLAIWADQAFDEPDAEGRSVGRLDRKEALDMFTGINSGTGYAIAFIGATVLSQIYGPGRHTLPSAELAVLKGAYALVGGTAVGLSLTGPVFNSSNQYDTRYFPTDRGPITVSQSTD